MDNGNDRSSFTSTPPKLGTGIDKSISKEIFEFFFSFNLNPNSELSESIQPKSPVSKDGVRDMLVKHHLFSWDI
ncbi:unnamed protein product [Oppiella nova]|uniref:Uncharacterized protein n=1 Tax=Oppiella nova TaxID=334625 RepID=A0A7R9QAN0_9ACAR|nr:unnamed protein product [Oppiella nova]CAG2159651.1 unnamed protein product [Oppiella nova]